MKDKRLGNAVFELPVSPKDGNVWYEICYSYNFQSHTAALTQETVAEMHLTFLEHPVYIPDLSPCNYHMFDPLKETRFDLDDEVE